MDNDQAIQLTGIAEVAMRSPDAVLSEADMVAKALAKQAHKLGLYVQIGQSKHLKVEGWQMVGAMFRVTARIVSTAFLDYGQVRGFEATAEAYHIPTGQVIGRADAMCLSDEERWGLRPQYEKTEDGKRGAKTMQPVPLQQLRSMAQTRACSKVLSNAFKWIATMGGFAGTPAEEMTGHEHNGETGGVTEPQKKQPAGDCISEPQAKRMFAIGKQAGLPNEEYAAFLKKHGYDRSDEVKRSDYEAMVAELQGMGK